MSEYYNTKNVIIDNKHYCVFCGQECKKNTELGSYHNNIDDVDYYYCDCEQAILWLEMCDEIDKVHKKYLPQLKERQDLLKEIRYQVELKQLNIRYDK